MKKRILIATDIFGINEGLLRQCDSLEKAGIIVQCVSPYANERGFSNEHEAYSAFLDSGGMDAYIKKLRTSLIDKKSLLIVGFSAGASAIWALSEEFLFESALLFYPGQIRHYMEIKPTIKPVVVFPNREKHFDLQHIIANLTELHRAELLQINAGHGFVNPSSQEHNPILSASVFKFLTHWPRIQKENVLISLKKALDSNPDKNKKVNNG